MAPIRSKTSRMMMIVLKVITVFLENREQEGRGDGENADCGHDTGEHGTVVRASIIPFRDPYDGRAGCMFQVGDLKSGHRSRSFPRVLPEGGPVDTPPRWRVCPK